MTQREIIHDTLIQLVDLERAHAQSKHRKLHSNHEASSVLREEIEEVDECAAEIDMSFNLLWEYVCRDAGSQTLRYRLRVIRKDSINLAKEALQICAVARRWEEMLDEKEGNNGKP